MSDFDRIREEGERISREEGYKVLLAEIAARDKEIDKLRLTDKEKDAADEIERLLIGGGMRQTDAEYRDEISRLRLTDAEREAVERVSVAYDLLPTEGARQIAATLRGLLERLGGCTPQLDCGADRKSVASERCCIAGGPPFESAPITLTDAEREAITVACGDSSQWGRPHVATLMRLLERTK